MARPKRLITVAGTFATALAIGFVMQNGEAIAERFLPSNSDETEALSDASMYLLPRDVSAAAIVDVTAVLAARQFEDEPKVFITAVGDEVAAPAPLIDAALASRADCNVTMSVSAMPLAMLQVVVMAPCHPNSSFVVHHQGMQFTVLTDMKGQALFQSPALAHDAFVIVAFEDGLGAAAQATVSDLADFDRAVLQWQGKSDLQLHALEFGATYNEPGHIWQAAAGGTHLLNDGEGGYLMRLGAEVADDPLLAEVYTFPSGKVSRDGNVILNAEVAVTQANCGRELVAQSIQFSPTLGQSAVDLIMTMPDCDAIGELLVLKNMFQDLTLAQR